MTVSSDTATAHSPRARLLAAADELFYDEGVHTVGIDRIIERAGVAKATLYSTFGSKDELIAAYLRDRHARSTRRIAGAIERHRTPRAKLLAVFDAQAQLADGPGFRGCAFANATAESHGAASDAAAAEYRQWIRDLFVQLAAQAGARSPKVLARQLHLLYDGATLSARMDRDGRAYRAARAAAAALLDAEPAA